MSSNLSAGYFWSPGTTARGFLSGLATADAWGEGGEGVESVLDFFGSRGFVLVEDNDLAEVVLEVFEFCLGRGVGVSLSADGESAEAVLVTAQAGLTAEEGLEVSGEEVFKFALLMAVLRVCVDPIRIGGACGDEIAADVDGLTRVFADGEVVLVV